MNPSHWRIAAVALALCLFLLLMLCRFGKRETMTAQPARAMTEAKRAALVDLVTERLKDPR